MTSPDFIPDDVPSSRRPLSSCMQDERSELNLPFACSGTYCTSAYASTDVNITLYIIHELAHRASSMHGRGKPIETG